MNEGFSVTLLPLGYMGGVLSSLNGRKFISRVYDFRDKETLMSFLESRIGEKLAYTDKAYDLIESFSKVVSDLNVPSLVIGDFCDLGVIARHSKSLIALSGMYFKGEHKDCSITVTEVTVIE